MIDTRLTIGCDPDLLSNVFEFHTPEQETIVQGNLVVMD